MKEWINDILNRFVGMTAETRRNTIYAFIMALIDFLSAFHIIEFSDNQIEAIYKLVLVISTAIVWGYCSHYKNNDYTEAAVRGTGVTRQIKKEQEEDYIGERFFTNSDGDILSAEDFITEFVDGDTMAAEEMAAEFEEEEDNE